MDQATARPLAAVQLPPGPEMVDALRQAWDHGPALLPLSPSLPERELARLLNELRPATLTQAGATTALDGARPVDPEVAVVIATSGSTGAPRGVELTRAALEASAQASLSRLEATPDDRWLCCLPSSSVGGLQVLIRALVLGRPAVLVPRFTPAALAAAPSATHVALVPTMLLRLLDAGVDLGRFRRILLGGAAAPPQLLTRARTAGARVTVTYGMTETAGGCVYDGQPLDGVEVEVDGEGEGGRIRIRGAVVCHGYRTRDGRAQPEIREGWLHTDDLGRIGRDGRIEVLGRHDDVIVTGGANVIPARVAALLAGHPGVGGAEVVSRPDPEWGQLLVAVIVPAQRGAAPDLAALRDFLADRATPPELPRELVVLDRLPLLTSGKVDRLALRERVRQ